MMTLFRILLLVTSITGFINGKVGSRGTLKSQMFQDEKPVGNIAQFIRTPASTCFFLGTCFIALVDPPLPGGSIDNANESSAHLNRKSFISMIDARIGLNRFLEEIGRAHV